MIGRRCLRENTAWSALALLVSTLLSCAPSYQHDPNLDAELAERSKREGLGILTTAPTTGTLPIMYFDQRWRPFKCCGKFAQAWVLSGGGGVVALDSSQLVPEPSSPTHWAANVTLFGLDGAVTARPPLWIRANYIAVSHDGKMIAFRGQGGPPPSQGGIQLESGLLYGRIDTPFFRKIHSLNEGRDPRGWDGDKPPETFSWSREATEIVYANDGDIYIYSLARSASRPLTKGSNPLWSPDGAWVSYRGPDGEAMIVDPSGKNPKRLLSGRKVAYALHWSPDGHYLLLTLRSENSSTVWFQTAIYRLSDGAITPIGEPGIAGDDSAKDWVVTGPLQ
jgi:hypothetical protein